MGEMPHICAICNNKQILSKVFLLKRVKILGQWLKVNVQINTESECNFEHRHVKKMDKIC